jgi:2-desacetyl-2-hydroxyethyl bacteriochlorophyllide A dehydrogenase
VNKNQEQLSVMFSGIREIQVTPNLLPPPESNQAQIHTRISAISSGTEMLLYRGQAPSDLPMDDTLDSLSGSFTFPFKYGYALVGEVTALGEAVDPDWLGKLVFSFHPHESCFNAPTETLIPIPAGISPEEAVFLPNMETAVNLVMDGHPQIGEKVIVFGQGIVGLLTTAMLTRFPLDQLIVVDLFPRRLEWSQTLGATACIEAGTPDLEHRLRTILEANHRYDGADLIFELSGDPHALNQAIATAGFGGRIVIGSWYGQKKAPLELGGRFHRARLQLFSSQVSSLAPELSGRWTKQRRLQTAWKHLRWVKPAQFITHRFPIKNAAEAYHLLDTTPDQVIQIVLEYSP